MCVSIYQRACMLKHGCIFMGLCVGIYNIYTLDVCVGILYVYGLCLHVSFLALVCSIIKKNPKTVLVCESKDK